MAPRHRAGAARRVATRLCAALLVGLATARPAAAHDGTALIGPDALWRAWGAEPVVLLSLGVALWLYRRGVRRLWAQAGRGRGVARAPALAFAAGAGALAVALASPLDPLGGTLLAAHMAQHGLLVAAAPPLLLLGRPGVAFAWALPAAWRRRVFGAPTWRAVTRVVDALARPLPAGVLHGLALWGWHAPAAFDAALANPTVHAVEHLAFFGTALLFWRAVLDARHGRRIGQALGMSVATLVHGGLLGALITLAPFPLYRWYHGRTAVWGLTALEDQQLAGLIMWVPMSVVYLAAGLAVGGRLVTDRGAPGVAPADLPLITR